MAGNVHTTGLAVALVRGARVAVITPGGRDANAVPALTMVARSTRVTICAGDLNRNLDATNGRRAGVKSARFAVITGFLPEANTASQGTFVIVRASIAVIAADVEQAVDTTRGCRAPISRACVAVLAIQLRSAYANGVLAQVSGGTHVVIGTGQGRWQEHTAKERVTSVGCTRVIVGAVPAGSTAGGL